MDELAQKRTLKQLEAVIESGMQTFIEVGNALLEIRKNRLYRDSFATFEDYCRERWGWRRDYADKQIRAAAVMRNLDVSAPSLHTIVCAPQNEAQARELAQLPPEQQREVAATIDFTKATAKDVQVAVKKYTARPAAKKTPAPAGHHKAAQASDGLHILPAVALKLAAMPQPMSLEQICATSKWRPVTWSSKRIHDLQAIPWVQIERVRIAGQETSYRVTVNHELKRICDGERPSKSGETPNDFCRRLLVELTRQREEINNKTSNGRWLPENVSKLKLAAILDWIQGELENFNGGQSVDGREGAA